MTSCGEGGGPGAVIEVTGIGRNRAFLLHLCIFNGFKDVSDGKLRQG